MSTIMDNVSSLAKSEGHIAFVPDTHRGYWEYYVVEGKVFRQTTSAPVMPDGYRAGRWYSPATDKIVAHLKAISVGEEYGDLLHVIGDVEMAGFCDSRLYREWEQNVAEPELEGLGYRVIKWETGESDSWGPLSRVVTVEIHDVRKKLVYG